MCEMFISQGCSGPHLLKKPGRGFPDSGWSVSGSRCCTSHLCGTSNGWILQNNCSWWFLWSVHWCHSCGIIQLQRHKLTSHFYVGILLLCRGKSFGSKGNWASFLQGWGAAPSPFFDVSTWTVTSTRKWCPCRPISWSGWRLSGM